jgi:hypothetical protein
MVDSIGGFNVAAFAASSGLARKKAAESSDSLSQSPASTTASTAPTAKDTFLNYMKKTPAQRMEENWMKSHGYDEKKLAAMTPDERAKVMKQMKDQIEEALKTQTEQKAQRVDITA